MARTRSTEVAERRRRAARLRAQGKTVDQIAAKLGVAKVTAYQDLRDYRAACKQLGVADDAPFGAKLITQLAGLTPRQRLELARRLLAGGGDLRDGPDAAASRSL